MEFEAGRGDRSLEFSPRFRKVRNHLLRYASQCEWTKEGGIPPQAVVNYMDGMDFINQYDITTGAPDEAQLTELEGDAPTT